MPDSKGKPRGLSIIIVNWNTREMTLALLDALGREIEGMSREVEVLLVDNDSGDGSVEAVRAVHPWVRTLPQDRNGGFAFGVNRGLEQARHPYILLLNSDVVLGKGDLERSCRFLDSHPEIGVLGPEVRGLDGNLHDVSRRFPSLWTMTSLAFLLFRLFPRSHLLNWERYAERKWRDPTTVDYVGGAVFFLRRELVERIGGLDEGFFMYFEETDFCRRTWKAGYEVGYLPGTSFLHEVGGSAKAARRKTFLAFRRSQIRYLKLHHGRVASLAGRAVAIAALLFRGFFRAPLALCPGRAGARGRTWLGLYLAAVPDLLRPHPETSRITKLRFTGPSGTDPRRDWN